MDKMQFENGTLVTPAKVTIDGIEHEVTPAVYKGKTPFSAENINKMQDNIERAIAVGGVAGDTLPIGSVVEFASDAVIPENWLLCNGQEVSRTEYNLLFAIIGTTWGEGDGSTTFNVPTKEGLVTVGKTLADGDFNFLGKTGGEKAHTLTVNEIPSHKHGFRAVKDIINTDSEGNEGLAKSSNSQGNNFGFTNFGYDAIENTGGSQPHNILQPYVTSNFIIKAKQSAGVVATVVDSLDSDSETDALSAKQGKKLNNNMLKTAIISGTASGQENKKYTPDYSSIEGTIISSVLVGCVDHINNNNITKCIPHFLNEQSNQISSVTVSTTATSETTIKILVLYI